MSISLTRVFLPIVLVLAFLVRWEPTRTLHLAPDERDLGASRWLIDDPDTCQHMRRIELALATDKVVSFDRFVNYPDGGEVPALPLYDTMVAGIAQRFLRSPNGDVALGQVDEADLEDMAIKLAPILGLLMVLATWIAARNVVSGPRGDAAALVAAAVVALYPACVSVSSAGTLAPISLACVLFALLIRSIVRCVSAEAMPGALLDAMVGGALAGILCACTSLGIVLFAAGWIALTVHAVRTQGDARARAVRAALIFCLVAAFLARMPLNEGPWEDGGGIVRGFASGVSMLLFLSTAPFILMLLIARNEKQRAFGTLCFVAALVLMAWQLPQVWRDLAPALRWYFGDHALIGDVGPDRLRGEQFETWLAVGAMFAAATWVWRDRQAPSSQAVLIFALVTVAAQWFTQSVPLVIVAGACLFARALDLRLAVEVGVTRRIALRSAAILPLALLAATVFPMLRGIDASVREERIEFASGLRWMRANTESGGAWNSPRGENSWGVLSTIADGPLVEYHARRPAVAAPWAVLSGASALQQASQAWWLEPPQLERFLQGQRVRFIVLAARTERWRRDFLVAIRDMPSGSMSTKSALESVPVIPGQATMWGPFERVHASLRRIDTHGHLVPDANGGAPVIAIWKMNAGAVESPLPQMRPR